MEFSAPTEALGRNCAQRVPNGVKFLSFPWGQPSLTWEKEKRDGYMLATGIVPFLRCQVKMNFFATLPIWRGIQLILNLVLDKCRVQLGRCPAHSFLLFGPLRFYLLRVKTH
jgi:hypothetical protein